MVTLYESWGYAAPPKIREITTLASASLRALLLCAMTQQRRAVTASPSSSCVAMSYPTSPERWNRSSNFAIGGAQSEGYDAQRIRAEGDRATAYTSVNQSTIQQSNLTSHFALSM